MSDESGEGCGDGDEADCDAFVAANAGRVDRAARRALEVEGHALFLAGAPEDVAANRLAPAVEADLRARLLKACGGQQAEVEVSLLTLTSPTGRYGDHPYHRQLWGEDLPPGPADATLPPKDPSAPLTGAALQAVLAGYAASVVEQVRGGAQVLTPGAALLDDGEDE